MRAPAKQQGLLKIQLLAEVEMEIECQSLSK
jgi:hypothetical protein